MYRFEANNGCSVCNAMEGLYEEEPARPHPYCRCIISVVDDDDTTLTRPTSGRTGGLERTGDGWEWVWDDPTGTLYNSDKDGDGYGESYRAEGSITVECCDGVTVTGEVYDLEFSVREAGPGEDWRELLEESLRAAEMDMERRAGELREADCEPCDHIA